MILNFFLISEQKPKVLENLICTNLMFLWMSVMVRVAVSSGVGPMGKVRVFVLAPDPDVLVDSGLLDGFTEHDAVLFKLLREDRVEKGIAAGVQRQDEDGKDLGLF